MAFNRVKQWTTFARVWYLFDAKWQDPIIAGKVLSKYLLGKNKPIWSAGNDCGDYVVVINSKEICLKDDSWRTFNYFHHTRYARGATYTPAWEFHENDPTRIIKECTKNAMPPKFYRYNALYRMLVYPDDKVPAEIIKNVSDQIRPMMNVPKPLTDYTDEDIKNFPRLFEWPKDFVIDDLLGTHRENPLKVVKIASPATTKTTSKKK